ncbi:uncharacterized protein PHACADRAFT_252960 [Phanerochaete carnosa HHB-10118-sp]|uniref:Uncharacterized protein n=1 Tax=Phanerochaete carnosa (strain HHB-10118-sp) TaxID=650164 RepID=K5WGT4_PHACS|nr:uncharacterized protein PHACADRAFT_252960 [Phanerochaete carnosa HHB-10118-sp]EKM58540.1 hypothetical protein PHACADRAFT_252960 [Phanerochaete carnosa HHB-10118-sp]
MVCIVFAGIVVVNLNAPRCSPCTGYVVHDLSPFHALKVLVLGIKPRVELVPYYSGEPLEDPHEAIEIATATIRTLADSASLDYIELRFWKCQSNFPNLKKVFNQAGDQVAVLESILLHCVEAGRVSHVRLRLYGGDYANLEFSPTALFPSSDYASTLFPELFEHGVLYAYDG